MSTKIWTAYRVRGGRDVWPLVPVIRRRAERAVKGVLTDLYVTLIEAWRANDAERKVAESAWNQARARRMPWVAEAEPHKLKATPLGASQFVRGMYLDQLGRMERDAFDLTVEVSLRKSRRGWLIIPYPGSGFMSGTLKFLDRMKPELEDYHYQNQTDRPAHVSARAWAERARTWAPLLESWRDQLVISVLNGPYGFGHVDPTWDLKGPHKKRLDRYREKTP